jgi:hypothetical protein
LSLRCGSKNFAWNIISNKPVEFCGRAEAVRSAFTLLVFSASRISVRAIGGAQKFAVALFATVQKITIPSVTKQHD